MILVAELHKVSFLERRERLLHSNAAELLMRSMDMYFWSRIVAILFLLAAVGPWPYDYFTLMRFIVSAVTAYGSYLAYERARTASTAPWGAKQQRWSLAFVLIALLFNPFVPIHLERATWTVIDVGVALILVADVSRDYRAKRK